MAKLARKTNKKHNQVSLSSSFLSKATFFFLIGTVFSSLVSDSVYTTPFLHPLTNPNVPRDAPGFSLWVQTPQARAFGLPVWPPPRPLPPSPHTLLNMFKGGCRLVCSSYRVGWGGAGPRPLEKCGPFSEEKDLLTLHSIGVSGASINSGVRTYKQMAFFQSPFSSAS